MDCIIPVVVVRISPETAHTAEVTLGIAMIPTTDFTLLNHALDRLYFQEVHMVGEVQEHISG